jgi:diguanylate cyclase (GGDEF)-like protein/PAS domain S-box-containing protein
VHPADLERALASFDAAFALRIPYEAKYRLRRADGEYRWVVDAGVPRYDGTGEFVGYVGSCADVSDLIDAETAVRRGEDRFRALVQHSMDMISIYDAEARFSFASPSHETVLGYVPEDLIGTQPVDLLHPDERDSVAEAFGLQLQRSGSPEPVEHRVRHKDGSWRYVESIAVDLRSDPAVAEILSVDQARILELVARGAPLVEGLDAVVRMIERWNPGACAGVAVIVPGSFTLRFVAAPNLPPDVFAALDKLEIATTVPRRKERDFMWGPILAERHQPEAALLADGFQSYWAALIADAAGERPNLGAVVLYRTDEAEPADSDRRILEVAASLAAIAIERDSVQERLAHQASHDALTGLPNRQTVLERLRYISEGAQHDGSESAVLFLDIDRFKVLNDSVGHAAGDQLLEELGARLRTALRPGDLVARFGGDEFVMVCERVGDEHEAYALANRVLEVVREPFDIDGNQVVVTASIGIAMVDNRAPEALLRDADAAMYWAKERGRARAELFDEHLRQRVVQRLDVERELRHAVDECELVLYYQPVVALETGCLAGFEALLRWPHPTRGVLEPGDFLPVAEETGLIRPIDAWVRQEACAQAARWRKEHPEWGAFAMGVNIDASDLRDRDLARGIESAIRASGFDPSALVLEISERFLADDTEGAVALLASLRELGVLIALDDFGTGAAALIHLKGLEVDSIKIDRAFVAGLGVNRFDDAIVDAMVELTRRLDLVPVAEGVETAEQEQILRNAGCLLAQGHSFAPALAPDDAVANITRLGSRITFESA